MTTLLSIRGQCGLGSPSIELSGCFTGQIIPKLKQFCGTAQPFYLTTYDDQGKVLDRHDSIGEHNANRTNEEIEEFFETQLCK